MNRLVSNVVLKLFDPFHIVRNLLLIPASILGFIDLRQHERHIVEECADGDSRRDSSQSETEQHEKTRTESPTARDIALRTTFITFAAAIIIWVSIFMYITFYYTYMPAIEHLRPVHIQYE